MFRDSGPRLTTLLAVLLLVGCSPEPSLFEGVRKPSEPISQLEWDAFRRIVEQLPEGKLQEFPAAELPLPQWQKARTLPVEELAAEEQSALTQAWEPSQLVREVARIPRLPRLLRSEGMSLDQFVGLTLTLGAAMTKSALPEDFPFEDVLRRGNAAISHLSKDRRVFSTLSLETRHKVLSDAVWLHRIDRAKRLSSIPEENVARVRENSDWLKRVMPKVFTKHPFEDVVDLLEEQGLPFVELPESGTDANIEWSPEDAIKGP